MGSRVPIGKRLRRVMLFALLGSLGVTLVTAVCFRLQANFAVAGFLYLLVVLLESLAGDLAASVIVCLAAAGCLDYFFSEPRYTLFVARASDVIALLAFLATALIITELVTRARREASSALHDREHVRSLYRLSQHLLTVKPEAVGTRAFLEQYLGVFGCTAVCLFDGDTATVHVAGMPAHNLPSRTRDSFVGGQNLDDIESGVCIRPLEVGGRLTGAIGFESLQNPQMTANSLAALTATLLERAKALRDAGTATAAAQAEIYRSAILDALAHEFKTPLATISAAAGGLAPSGQLNAEQLDLIELIESETARLGGLTSRLLRMARLDREEVRPRMEMTDLAALLSQLMEQQRQRYPDRRVSLVSSPTDLEVYADPELLRLALSQVLENACKYSQPSSTVKIQLEEQAESISVRISNTGSAIASGDERRIFERFYRGQAANHHVPGSGLGLYVARKIAAAHGGGLDLEKQSLTGTEVTFRFTIPLSRKTEVDHVVTTN